MAKLAKLRKGYPSWVVKTAIAVGSAIVGGLVEADRIPAEVAQTVLDVLREVGQVLTGS